jgi:RNA polymerase sigma factor (sigma-70 family)
LAAVPSTGRASEVERAAAPEADATRALYERYAGQIYGFCLHRLGSREEAEDAVQTTFLNAFRGLRRGVVPEAESAWLFKIAENVCLTRHRSSWRRGRVESPSDMQALQDVTPARERDGDELIPLGDALAAMPETQRRAILLREWQGLSYKEIAGELDLSQSAVETLIFRARRSLANALETPWRERRAAGQAGRRAFDVTSLLAGLKALFAGGAAKVAVVAVAATGTAALAVAESRHPPEVARVEPSAAAARAPDSVRSFPVLARPAPGYEWADGEPARAGAAGKPEPATRAARAGAARGAAVEKARGEHPAAPGTSSRPETPPGQAKERGKPVKPAARAERSRANAKPKPKSKPKKATAQAKPAEPGPNPKPDKPKAEQPKTGPAPPPPPAAGQPAENGKDKDEPK